ncbi:MAG: LysM peptidoglycan-binding domain-containing protein [Myxacorys californica WJT36-NPBG1]|jgi:LysM repeat protein|nr:LysM peptidoglycan-binding domain-containing protein [Myxacorys californica WJT36-NPBG1]
MEELQYEVSSGSTLADIAYETLGSSSNFREIADWNELDIFQQLPIGQSLSIPSKEELKTLAINLAKTEVRKAVDPLLKDLDLSSLKAANPFGLFDHQLISWLDL